MTDKYIYLILGVILGAAIVIYWWANREEKIEREIQMNQKVFSTFFRSYLFFTCHYEQSNKQNKQNKQNQQNLTYQKQIWFYKHLTFLFHFIKFFFITKPTFFYFIITEFPTIIFITFALQNEHNPRCQHSN